MTNKNKDLHLLAGLVEAGEEDGEQLYIGTDLQWQKYEELINKENI